MMPSSPIFTTPPRSACTAPSDASRIGIVTRIAEARSATLKKEVRYSIAWVFPQQLESWRVEELDYSCSALLGFDSPTLQLSNSSTSCRFRRWCRGHRELCLALALGPHVPGQQ